jgi:hypothetical protein
MGVHIMGRGSFSFNQQNKIIREVSKIEGVSKILSLPSAGLVFFVHSAIGAMSLLKIKEVCTNGNIPFEVVR